MTASEAIQPHHHQRQALIYLRQSSPQQVLRNAESLKLQYALRDRAAQYGWEAGAIHVIDTDLGVTGSSTVSRPGFQELVTRVTLGQVGIIFAYDVTRRARNCTDWYQLLDLCGYRQCLVADQEGVYDPATPNGRLILGLKGLIAELELHTIKARLQAGLLNKARRGELALSLPVGLVRDLAGRVVFHPDQEVRERLAFIFATFLRVKSVYGVVRDLAAAQLLLPRRQRGAANGAVVWRRPRAAAVASLLRNPAYAGTYVYGRTRFRAARSRRPEAETSVGPGALAGHDPRPISRLPGSRHLRYHPIHPARQLPGIAAAAQSRCGSVRRGLAPGLGLLRTLRPQDDRAISGRCPLCLQPAQNADGRHGMPAPADRRAGRLRGAKLLGGLDACRSGRL